MKKILKNRCGGSKIRRGGILACLFVFGFSVSGFCKSNCKYWLGEGHKTNDPDKKIECYTKAIKSNPKSAVAYYCRGLAYYVKDLYDKSIDDYSKAIELSPKFSDVYCSRGFAYDSKGLYDKAVEDFTKVIEMEPKGADAYNSRGNTYTKKGLYDEAIKDFNKAGDLLEKDGKVKEAVNSYKSAQELSRKLNSRK